jgi:diguanylate cyclase (GGDEF)-like protein/PAS domain S-box-containing protein
LAAELVLHHLRPLVAVIDKHGVFVDAWGAHGAFLGYRPSDLIGRPSLDIVATEEKEMVATVFRQAAERADFSVDMPVPFPLTLVTAAGAHALVDVSAVAVRHHESFQGWVLSFVPHSTRSAPTDALEELVRGGSIDEVLARCADGLVGDRTDSRHLVGCVLSEPVHGRFTRLHGRALSGTLRTAVRAVLDVGEEAWPDLSAPGVSLLDLDEVPATLAAAARAERFEGMMVVPINVAGAPAAALVAFVAPLRRPLPGFVRRLLDHLAGVSALALTHQRSNDELRLAARRDALTGVANRRAFDELVAHGDPTQISVLYIDLDEFKAINDEHGHECGDRVLIEVARRIGTVCGPSGVVARLGGDEFALVLLSGDVTHAQAIGERVVASVCEPLPAGCGATTVTASVGLASGGTHLLVRDVLGAADRALLSAKRAGRNQLAIGD